MQSPILLVADDITDLEESIVKDSDGKFRCPLPDCLKPCSRTEPTRYTVSGARRGSTTRATSKGTRSGVLAMYHRVSGVECRMEETEATSDLTALKLEDWLALFSVLQSPVSSDASVSDFHPMATSEAVNLPEFKMDVFLSGLDLTPFSHTTEDMDIPIFSDDVSQVKIECAEGLDESMDRLAQPFRWEGSDLAPLEDYSFSQLLRDFVTPDDEM
ncbi:hypothetical protein HDU93_006525 [Gonapodya sp. JEL0774]|nr:hypothetical protein HDU93_006525 [Gonapodya sp. JEL0774]